MKTLINDHSAGVIPFRHVPGQSPLYLIIHSVLVRNPRARWEFPKGGIETGETPREAAEREFREETGIVSWAFQEGFQRSLSYTYLLHGRRHFKTVSYFVGEVFDASTLTRSHEHVEAPSGGWYCWGSLEEVRRLLYHAQVRQLLDEVDSWLRGLSSCDLDTRCHLVHSRLHHSRRTSDDGSHY